MPESYAGGEWTYIPETDMKYIPVVNDISIVSFAYKEFGTNDWNVADGGVYVRYDLYRLVSNGSIVQNTIKQFKFTCTRNELWEAYSPMVKEQTGMSDDKLIEVKTRFLSESGCSHSKLVCDKELEASCEEQARIIYESGKALEFMVNSCLKQHADDEHVFKTLFLSYASTKAINSTGIHVSISGHAGDGKTHCKDVVVAHIPEYAVDDSSKSDKVLYYKELSAGTVFIFDDQTLTDDLQGLLKKLSWNKPTVHNTVKNQEALSLTIPERCPFWVLKAEMAGDEQILDRQVMLHCTDGINHYENRRGLRFATYANPKQNLDFKINEKISRCIWDMVESAVVVIPYAERIAGGVLEDGRVDDLLLSLITASAVLHQPKRERDSDGNVVASIEDFEVACSVMNPLLNDVGGSQVHKLPKPALELLKYLETQPSGTYTYAMLNESGVNLSHALNGRKMKNGSTTIGLLNGGCPAVTEVMRTVDSYEGCAGIRDSRKAITWNRECYLRWNNKKDEFYLIPVNS